MDNERLNRQIAFILEIDKLKNVLRRTYVLGEDRRENSAEHSWQLAVMALLLAEHAAEPINLLHVMKMVLVHDIVEIDAGDTYCYDDVGARDKREREERAAERIFTLLPSDQAGELRALWEEFEEEATPEAKFGAALDRIMPTLLNFHTEGRSWKENGITFSQVKARNERSIKEGAPALWEVEKGLFEEAVSRGYLKPT